MADRDAKRRFLALKVDEVSLVDSPANEQEFIVIKRLATEETTTMGAAAIQQPAPAGAPAAAEANVAKVAEGQTTTTNPEAVPVQVEKAADETSAKVLAQVEKLTEMIAKGFAPSAPVESDVEKANKKAKAKEEMQKKLEGAGLKGVALEKAVDAALAAEEAPTAKAAEPAEGAADEGEAVSKTLEALAEVIQKAKTFTPKREKAMKTLMEDLQKLLSDMSSAPATQAPASIVPGSGLSDIKKALEEVVATMKEHVTTTTKALAERVESIEKTRNPSQSVEPAAAPAKTTETKKSLWSGVL